MPSPLPKTLKPVFAIPGLGPPSLFDFSIPAALDLLALIVDGAASAVDPDGVRGEQCQTIKSGSRRRRERKRRAAWLLVDPLLRRDLCTQRL